MTSSSVVAVVTPSGPAAVREVGLINPLLDLELLLSLLSVLLLRMYCFRISDPA